YPFGRWLELRAPRLVPVEVELPDVDAIAEQVIHFLHAPGPAAHRDAVVVEPGGEGLHAHTPALQTVQVQVEDSVDAFCFARIYFSPPFLPAPRPRHTHIDHAVAEWCTRAVPVPLSSVLFHGLQGVLGVFLALVFVEQAEKLPSHLA